MSRAVPQHSHSIEDLPTGSGPGKLLVSGSVGYLVMVFEAAGAYAVSTQVGGRRRNRIGQDLTIVDVSMHREVAGTSGSTTIDVNINGTTAYTNQANRPTVGFAEGADAEDQGLALPDIVLVPAGSYLTVDLDAVEGGGPQNTTVSVTLRY